MSSAGQFIGGAVGAIGGFILGGPAGAIYGAQIGITAGGLLDPPKGPKLEGPRLSDLRVQTSSYGLPIPRVYGSMALTGNVFWVENNQLKEVATTQESGGGKGGGGGSETTTYSYFVTCAIGLCEGPVENIRRIWVGSKLIYDGASTDIGTVLAGHNLTGLAGRMVDVLAEVYTGVNGDPFTIYFGTDYQLPDDRMEATLGVGNVPAYRGLCYLVLKDYPLADHGNSLLGAQVKVEVVTGAQASHQELLADIPNGDPANTNYIISVRFADDLARTISRSESGTNDYLSLQAVDAYYTAAPYLGSKAALPAWHTGAFDAKITPPIYQSDADVIFLLWWHVNASYWVIYSASGAEVMNSSAFPVADTILPTSMNKLAYTGGLIYAGYDSDQKIFALSEYGIAYSTASTYNISAIGYSANYIFAVLRTTTSTTTVYRFNRDLSLDATYVQNVPSVAAIADGILLAVESDSVFYTMAQTGGSRTIWRWENGIASDTGCRFSGTWGTFLTRLSVKAPGVFLVYTADYSTAKLYAVWNVVSTASVELSSIIRSECLSSGLLSAGDIDVSEITADVRGYRVSSVAAIRSALEPLQASWPFDAIQSGYRIKFKPRGSSSVATVADADLGTGSKPVKITHAREMDSQIARRVEVNYLDADREYDAGAPGLAERLNVEAVNVQQIELPIVLTPDEAAGKAETLLYLYWLERNDLSFTLPPTYINLEPADVITISAGNASYEARLTGINYLPDGSLECSAKFNSAAVYTPVTVGQQSLALPPTVPYAGPTLGQFLDVPAVFDQVDKIGFPAAIYGPISTWPGGALFRSDDDGLTWTALASVSSMHPVVGLARYALASGRTDQKDAANSLTIEAMPESLSSVTEAQMLAGANHFAVGDHGRWEIIGAQTCTQQGDGSWLLTDLLRGRFGTEWAMSSHAVFDKVIRLDLSRLVFVSTPQSAINAPRTYRAVTNGATLDSASDIPFTYCGVNLRPLSPAYAAASLNQATGNWSLAWIRRTRVGGEWSDYVDATLGEAAESYDIEFYTDATFETLKRTIYGVSAASCSYTIEQQIEDYGSMRFSIFVKIYQNSQYVGRGYAHSSQFSLPGDNYYASVMGLTPSLYYRFDEASGNIIDSSASLLDGSPTSVTYGRPSLLSLGFSKSIGMNAGWIQVSNNAMFNAAWSAAFLMTMDNVTGASNCIFHKGETVSTATYGYFLSTTTSGALRLDWYNGTYRSVETIAGIIASGSAYRIAMTYDGATAFKVYVDGALVLDQTLAAAFVTNTQPMTIGAKILSGAKVNRWSGDLDEFAWFNYALSGANVALLVAAS